MPGSRAVHRRPRSARRRSRGKSIREIEEIGEIEESVTILGAGAEPHISKRLRRIRMHPNSSISSNSSISQSIGFIRARDR